MFVIARGEIHLVTDVDETLLKAGARNARTGRENR
jgi:hypothetical protein